MKHENLGLPLLEQIGVGWAREDRKSLSPWEVLSCPVTRYPTL